MTTPVVTVSPDTPAGEIAEALTRHRISAIPVIDETGGVVGLVSDYDLLATPGRTAREVMTTAVISVTEDTDIGDVRQLLVDRRIRRLPVLAGGRLVGIVSRADVVALMGDRVGVPGVRRTGPWRRPAGCVSEVSGRQGAVRPAGAAARNLSAAASAPTDGYTR